MLIRLCKGVRFPWRKCREISGLPGKQALRKWTLGPVALEKLALAVWTAVSLTACGKSEQLPKEIPSFTLCQENPHTPVRHQGRTSTCWAFATTGMLESEWLLRHPGDTLRLSVMYFVRQKYLNQLEAYYYSHGREEIRSGSLGHSLWRVLQEDGAVPYEAYKGYLPGARRHDHRSLLKQLKNLAEEAVDAKDLEGYRKKAEALLDQELGAVPDTFVYRGHRYTPRSFADSLKLCPSDYMQVTSLMHHPYRKAVVVEFLDNWEHGTFVNLPLDEWELAIRKALSEGHTLAWHGDVSESTYLPRQGFAYWPVHPVTAELRQQEYARFQTTDDHMMLLVGTARDEAGKLYYRLKDSYG